MTTLIDDVEKNVYTQQYGKKVTIDGVTRIPLSHFPTDEGDFGEVMRLTQEGTVEAMPEFKVRQVSRSTVFPGSIKGWHLHQDQDELWYVQPSDQLFIGLWDTRKESATQNTTMRLNMGGGISQLLYIPRGVAHGCANYSTKTITLLYFVNNVFNREHPDELRIPYNTVKDFWLPERD